MSLLNTVSVEKPKKVVLSVAVETDLLNEINAYCTWAKIKSKREFATQSFLYILENDKEWKKIYMQTPPNKITDTTSKVA